MGRLVQVGWRSGHIVKRQVIDEKRWGQRCLKSACLAWREIIHSAAVDSEAKLKEQKRAARHFVSPPNNDEHCTSQTALGASFAACAAGWYVYSFMFG